MDKLDDVSSSLHVQSQRKPICVEVSTEKRNAYFIRDEEFAGRIK